MSLFPPPRDFQSRAHDALREGVRAGHKNQMLMAPTGGGKCLGKDTPVLMSNGFIKLVQDIQVGDELLGPDGLPRKVLSVTKGQEKLYKITPQKGDPYVVNASHILSLKKSGDCSGIILSDGTKIKKDQEIVNINVETFLNSNQTAKHCLKGWRSDAINSFNADEIELKMPPYLMGAWLGDGTQGSPSLSKPYCKMIEEWCNFGVNKGLSVKKRQSGSCPTWYLSNGKDRSKKNIITSILDHYGVLKHRHIPAPYKYASLQDRRELIAGLIDSDGHINHSGCDWISKSGELANDFAFVCRSVGLACYINKTKKSIKASGFEGSYWRASISGDLSQIPMRDKKSEARLQKKRHLVHGIKIEDIGIGDYYGFEIDGDHLFLLGDFTVTHNTYLGLRIISEAMARGKKAVFLCDRKTLINQTSETSDAYGLDHGIYQSNHWRVNLAKPFQIASAQTIARRGMNWPEADVIVIDEAHTQLKAWTEFIPNTKAYVIGLSATPFSKGLGKLFSNLVNAATMKELTDSGVLVPLIPYSGIKIDMAGAETSGGEWTDKASEERGLEIVGDVVSEWLKIGENRKTIVFGSTIKHCEEMCRQFNEAGVLAEMFTSETEDEDRKKILNEFRKPDSAIRVLISVEALAKGFDVPDVSCVADCRPLRKSLSTAIQMWGRGTRSSPNKENCILLDFAGNFVRFLADFEDIYHNGLLSLDNGEKLDKEIRKNEFEKEKQSCPKCGYTPFFKTCMSCGHEKIARSNIEVFSGEMQMVEFGKGKHRMPKPQAWDEIVCYMKLHAKPSEKPLINRAIGMYKNIVGTWPTPEMKDRFNYIDGSIGVSEVIFNQIKHKQIAFAKSRR